MTWHDEIKTFLETNNLERPELGFDIGQGWKEPVFKAILDMKAAGWEGKLAQIKQKFCQLRLYYDWDSQPDTELRNRVDDCIRIAVRACDNLCELCGNEREEKGSGWGMAACNACKKKRENEI